MASRQHGPTAPPGHPRERISDEQIGALLRRGAETITVPPALMARLQAAAREDEAARSHPTGGARRLALGGRMRVAFAVAAVAAALVPAALAADALQHGGNDHGRKAAVQAPPPPSGIALTVYNVEEACQPLRTLECALGLARSPYTRYTAANVVAHVWHGDVLNADCVVRDGQLVTDEHGMSSGRWYHVASPQGWLPGVRTRNELPLPDCPMLVPAETPAP
ncbi:hypothetical protein ACPA54_17470 [Uniformispora flossi]|uniref:hypothetical protein n=1 Tax=Uniformispora flossi TaxID=3390723 RepID=UPI003C2D7E16